MGERIQFGPFEAHPALGQLRKGGQVVRLQEQPFRLLLLLAGRPDEVVTREEIRAALWPAGTFVEFEHSLNTAVNRLRTALEDSASHPRYVETVPRRGYRFVGTIANGGERPRRRKATWRPDWRAMALAGALAVTSIGLFATFAVSTVVEGLTLPLRRFTIPFHGGFAQHAAISPDGRKIGYMAYSAGSRDVVLWVHDLASGEAQVLIADLPNSSPIVWRPDSSGITYAGAVGLETVSVMGGQPVPISNERKPTHYAWDPAGERLYTTGVGIQRRTVPGGAIEELIPPAEERWLHPSVLPGGEALLVTWSTLTQRSVVAVDLASRGRTTIARCMWPPRGDAAGECKAVWSPSGHVVYQSSGDLWAVAFDPETLNTYGDPFPVRENAHEPSMSADGTLVHLTEPVVEDAERLVWRTRKGFEFAPVGEAQDRIMFPALSPDGKRVAVLAADDRDWEIWVHKTSGGGKLRVTREPTRADRPAWDGDHHVIYTGWGRGMFRRRADGLGPATQLHDDGYGYGWSADGARFVFEFKAQGEHCCDIGYMERKPDGEYEAVTFLADGFDSHAPQLSPDGQWLAYASNASGQYEVYVRQFPEGGAAHRVSENGGVAPRWRRDGEELFYVSLDNPPAMMAAPVRPGESFWVGEVEELFTDGGLAGRSITYDVSADGQRFVTVKTIKPPARTEVHVVQNWFAEFQ